LIILSLIIITMTVSVAAMGFPIQGTKDILLAVTRIATFDEPWAMTFLPDDTLLVAEKRGVLWQCYRRRFENRSMELVESRLWQIGWLG
jgi:hypothetical protein